MTFRQLLKCRVFAMHRRNLTTRPKYDIYYRVAKISYDTNIIGEYYQIIVLLNFRTCQTSYFSCLVALWISLACPFGTTVQTNKCDLHPPPPAILAVGTW